MYIPSTTLACHSDISGSDPAKNNTKSTAHQSLPKEQIYVNTATHVLSALHYESSCELTSTSCSFCSDSLQVYSATASRFPSTPVIFSALRTI